MKKIQVGLTKIVDAKNGKERPYKYSDIPKEIAIDLTGWVFNLKYLPIPFDLLHLKVKGKDKPTSGWWTGQDWDGLRLKSSEKVVQWKRNHEYD